MSTLAAIRKEAERAHGKFGPPTSSHEALGVLIEEVDELRAAIHDNRAEDVEREAIQVAACAYRLAMACASLDLPFYNRSGFTGAARG